jgi:hypothetical protein
MNIEVTITLPNREQDPNRTKPHGRMEREDLATIDVLVTTGVSSCDTAEGKAK